MGSALDWIVFEEDKESFGPRCRLGDFSAKAKFMRAG